MTKNTLIRSDKKHAVKMPAGSNVAERKTTRKFSEPDVPEAPVNIQKLDPVKNVAAKRNATPPATKTVRAKASLTPPPPPPAKATKSAISRPAARKTKAAKPAAPQPPIWGMDSQVKARIDQLKTRNAQLSEQLQRLSTSPTARGKRP